MAKISQSSVLGKDKEFRLCLIFLFHFVISSAFIIFVAKIINKLSRHERLGLFFPLCYYYYICNCNANVVLVGILAIFAPTLIIKKRLDMSVPNSCSEGCSTGCVICMAIMFFLWLLL